MIQYINSFLSQIFRLCIILIITFYRYFISPLLGVSCRFQPTCSEYALDALNTHGARKGIYYSLIRILRCNPLGRGGFDPVPQNKGKYKCQTKKD